MTINTKELKSLYNKTSKHSNYQKLSTVINQIIDVNNHSIKSRHEEERLKFICENINLRECIITDIGGNTGYFSFTALEHGAKTVHYFEGNKTHVQFVEHCAKLPQYSGKIKINPKYIDLSNEPAPKDTEILLLLNVLHHIGDDYGINLINKEEALKHIKSTLNALASQTKYLVFQLGFNWKGDIRKPLFEYGTKKEMIYFIKSISHKNWIIEEIGIATKQKNKIIYTKLNEYNISRQNELGEFLNRPIFIFKSRFY